MRTEQVNKKITPEKYFRLRINEIVPAATRAAPTVRVRKEAATSTEATRRFLPVPPSPPCPSSRFNLIKAPVARHEKRVSDMKVVLKKTTQEDAAVISTIHKAAFGFSVSSRINL